MVRTWPPEGRHSIAPDLQPEGSGSSPREHPRPSIAGQDPGQEAGGGVGMKGLLLGGQQEPTSEGAGHVITGGLEFRARQEGLVFLHHVTRSSGKSVAFVSRNQPRASYLRQAP